MSRIIKNFGYQKDIDDELVLTAWNVTELNMPRIKLSVSKDFQEFELSFDTSCWSDEEKPGVILKLINKDDPSIYGEILIDENEFADEIYDVAVVRKGYGISSEKIGQWILTCLKQEIIPILIEQGYWFKTRDGEWINTLSE